MVQVNNTGNVDLTNVLLQHEEVVYDECPIVVNNVETLGPGESYSCKGTYMLLWRDIEAGVLDKSAE